MNEDRPFVVVRVQPPAEDTERGLGVVGNTITWIHHAEEKEFRVDDVVAPSELPDVICPLVVATVERGVNAAVVSMGQQSSGKTTALFEDVIPALGREIFAMTATVRMSFIEVYGDKAVDVLKGKATKCRPQFHRSIGAYASDLTRLLVPSLDQFEKTLALCLRAVAIECLTQNKVHGLSCRILSLYIKRTADDAWSRLDFVDMPATGQRHRVQSSEHVGFVMAQGLHHVETCWRHLAEGDDYGIVPFGDTTTSTLLQHLFGAATMPFVIANVVQSALQNEENLTTLRHTMLLHAIPCKLLPQKQTTAGILQAIDVDLQEHRDRVNWLKAKLQLNDAGPAAATTMEQELQAARQSIRQLESLHADFHKDAIEYHQDQLKFQCGVEGLSLSLGTALLEHDSLNVYLVRLHEEALFSRLFRFNIAVDETVVGRLPPGYVPPERYPGIALFGAGAAEQHCRFAMRVAPHIDLVPEQGVCLVNGVDVATSYTLQHGDTLTLGRRNVFRVFIPRVHALEPIDLHRFYCRDTVVRNYACSIDWNAQRHCHEALTRIIDRIATIRTMHAQGLVTPDEEVDMHDLYLQKGSSLEPAVMTTEMRLATIRRLSLRAIDEMNILETRISTGYVMTLLDYVDEANAMAKEVNEPLVVRAAPVIQHMVTRADEDPIDRTQLQTDIWIVFQNPQRPRQRIIMRPHDFLLRLSLLRAEHLERVYPVRGAKPAVGAFKIDDGVEEVIGVAPLYLGRLSYYMDVDEAVPIVNRSGKVTGHLLVSVQPFVETKVYDPTTRREVFKYVHYTDHDIDKDEELMNAVGMNTHIEFHVTVRGARGLPPQVNSNVFVEYSFFNDERPRSTEPSPTKSSHPVIQETFVHRVLITEKLCHYLINSTVTFQVFGYRGDHIHLKSGKSPEQTFWFDLETKALGATIHALERKVDVLERQLHEHQQTPIVIPAPSQVPEAKGTTETSIVEPSEIAVPEEEKPVVPIRHATSWREAWSRHKILGRTLRAKSIGAVLLDQQKVSTVCALQ
ncbi:hypothetical protein ACHHYP_08787 [Achlya hypogyna]|uniref:Kinesin motor domain-containing protein n=1 Tax=Achlya hypogyna TaxID=1202772 RepID=A0A1V9YP00_ACHHY|nr:hypothetical protein ACHHYP_08787 [Achlya hypogyna]